MQHYLDSRRRQIRDKGRPMQLEIKRAGQADRVVQVLGAQRQFLPQEIQGGVQASDSRVEILADELDAVDPLLRPGSRDRLVIDGRTSTIKGAWPVFVRGTRIGWALWVTS